MPFPTAQGTQAAVAAMLAAEASADRSPTLLTYAHGFGTPPAGVKIHRLRSSFGDRSLRAGPSLSKVAQDAALALALRRVGRAKPLVAHHVEGALAALWAGRPVDVWIAHTALGPELPYYVPESMRALLGPGAAHAGHALDWLLPRCVRSSMAVSPLLATMLQERSGRRVDWLPLPWPVFDPPCADTRAKARARAGLRDTDEVVLYAGNLDAYQGLHVLLDALARLRATRRALRVLIATNSDPIPLGPALAARGLSDITSLSPLDDEPLRARLHAAADVVAVPREAAGGLPVKLIDALARAAPVACVPRALAGTNAGEHVFAASDASAQGLCSAIDQALADREGARTRAAAGRAWVATEMSDAAYLHALDNALARGSSGRRKRT